MLEKSLLLLLGATVVVLPVGTSCQRAEDSFSPFEGSLTDLLWPAALVAERVRGLQWFAERGRLAASVVLAFVIAVSAATGLPVEHSAT